jgi:hypothetical protein
VSRFRRFRSVESWKGCSEWGGGSLVRTDIVYASGRVEWTVEGRTQDDGTIRRSGVREYGPLDLDAVTAARLSSGWEVAP